MADGDEIHRSIRYRYQEGLKQVCERAITDPEIARTFARALRKELDSPFYNNALQGLFAVAIELKQAVDKADSGDQVDWTGVRHKLNNCLGGANLKRQVFFIAERACESASTHLQFGERPRNLDEYVTALFIDQEFRGQVLGKGPVRSDRTDLTQEEVDARLQQILPCIEPHLRYFAKQAVQQRSFHKLSLAPVSLHLPKRLFN